MQIADELNKKVRQLKQGIAHSARMKSLQASRRASFMPQYLSYDQQMYLNTIQLLYSNPNWLEQLTRLARFRKFRCSQKLYKKISQAMQYQNYRSLALRLSILLNLKELSMKCIMNRPDILNNLNLKELFQILSQQQKKYIVQTIFSCLQNIQGQNLICIAQWNKDLITKQPYRIQFYNHFNQVHDQHYSLILLILQQETQFQRLLCFKKRAIKNILGQSSFMLRFMWGLTQALSKGLYLNSDEVQLVIEKCLVLAMCRIQPLSLLAISLLKQVSNRQLSNQILIKLTISIKHILQFNDLNKQQCIGLVIICRRTNKAIQSQAKSMLKRYGFTI